MQSLNPGLHEAIAHVPSRTEQFATPFATKHGEQPPKLQPYSGSVIDRHLSPHALVPSPHIWSSRESRSDVNEQATAHDIAAATIQAAAPLPVPDRRPLQSIALELAAEEAHASRPILARIFFIKR